MGRIAGRLAQVKPIIYTEHDLSVQRNFKHFHYVMYLANLMTLPLNHFIISVSQFTYQDIQRHNYMHTPSELVYNGIDLDKVTEDPVDTGKIRKKYNIPSENLIVGHVANLRQEKRQENLIKAAKQILE
jgi:glycosyltransferase involved in cell wall biosynthesis